MNVGRLLGILPRNMGIRIYNENKQLLFEGRVWMLDSKYLLSCLVVDVFPETFYAAIVVIG